MAIEIVDFPIKKIWFFHGKMLVHQAGYLGTTCGHETLWDLWRRLLMIADPQNEGSRVPCDVSNVGNRCWKDISKSHRIHGAAIYGNMDPINIPPMLVYIPYMDPMGMDISKWSIHVLVTGPCIWDYFLEE